MGGVSSPCGAHYIIAGGAKIPLAMTRHAKALWNKALQEHDIMTGPSVDHSRSIVVRLLNRPIKAERKWRPVAESQRRTEKARFVPV
jgi:hypothetical protein